MRTLLILFFEIIVALVLVYVKARCRTPLYRLMEHSLVHSLHLMKDLFQKMFMYIFLCYFSKIAKLQKGWTVGKITIVVLVIGRIMLAVEKYKKSEASLEKASRFESLTSGFLARSVEHREIG
jgi:uncharacterized membrane protein